MAEIPETALRIRGRIESIIDAAKVKGLYTGDNPARWKGHLKAILPMRQRHSRKHFPAMAYDDLPEFIAKLREKQEWKPAGWALEFCILTATRSAETTSAQWSEFDLKKGIWTIPGGRMKAGLDHRIPLSPRALEILHAMERLRLKDNKYVFVGLRRGRPVHHMAMWELLKGMGFNEITVHGFRSTFSDWVSEQTSFSHETREQALAHQISDKADGAYRRGDQFEKRRKLMEAWQGILRQQAYRESAADEALRRTNRPPQTPALQCTGNDEAIGAAKVVNFGPQKPTYPRRFQLRTLS